MKNKELSGLSKSIAFISLLSLSIMLGSYITKLFTVYYLFEGPDLVLRDFIDPSDLDTSLKLLFPVHIIHLIAYLITITSLVLFVITSKLSLKQNGWLFIILLIFFLTLPFEAYLLTIDYKFITAIMSDKIVSTELLGLLRDRIQKLSSYPLVALISYISIYYFIILQPLTKSNQN